MKVNQLKDELQNEREERIKLQVGQLIVLFKSEFYRSVRLTSI